MKAAAIAISILVLGAWASTASAQHQHHGGQHGHHAQPAEDRIGQVSFPISCAPAAQKPFERAVALLHSFWYLEAVKRFTQVTQVDPQCAIGYWGMAMSHW